MHIAFKLMSLVHFVPGGVYFIILFMFLSSVHAFSPEGDADWKANMGFCVRVCACTAGLLCQHQQIF